MSKPAPFLPVALLMSIVLCASGCAPAAWFASQFGPEKNVAAKYQPSKGKTILVLVDDMLSPVDYEPVKMHLTEMLNKQLMTNKVAVSTVPYTRIGELIAATPEFNALSVSEVGSKLDADIVLYVQIDEFGLRDPSASEELWKGRLQVTVRMTDVHDGRLWPKDKPAGHMVPAAKTRTVSDNSPTRAETISNALATETADRIAKYFYDHKTPYEGAYGSRNEDAVID